jgi:hypothetical protein
MYKSKFKEEGLETDKKGYLIKCHTVNILKLNRR